MIWKSGLLATAALAAAGLSGCTTSQERVSGVGMGAVAGAAVAGPVGAVAGGVAGGVTGPTVARATGVPHASTHHRASKKKRPPA